MHRLLVIVATLMAAACGNGRGGKVQGQAVAAAVTEERDSLAVGLELLQNWTAGERVPAAAVEAFGEERCFVAEELSDSIFALMQGGSWREGAPSREELRYVKALHRNLQGDILLGEMVCSVAIVAELAEILHELYRNSYPIERMLLVDRYGADDESSMLANNSSCFNYRGITGGGKLSKHALGLAVDINPLYNPAVKRGKVYPPGAEKYADRSADFPYKIERGDLCCRVFASHGFGWGGRWASSKDYQHFEKSRKRPI